MTGVVEYVLAHPILLVPVLLIAATMVWALIKKLLKIAAILLIAGALYLLLVEYFGTGM